VKQVKNHARRVKSYLGPKRLLLCDICASS